MQPPVANCGCEDYGCLDQLMLDEAGQAKKDQIEIFAVRYGDSDAVDIKLMKAAASSSAGSDDHYFDAPLLKDFEQVFEQIARRLAFRLL